jgi:hypothetical protein
MQLDLSNAAQEWYVWGQYVLNFANQYGWRVECGAGYVKVWAGQPDSEARAAFVRNVLGTVPDYYPDGNLVLIGSMVAEGTLVVHLWHD